MFCQRKSHGVNALAESQADSHAAEKQPLQKSSGCGSKKWYPLSGFLNRNKDQNLRNPGSLILSHTLLMVSPL